jgi:hypothetical protein
MIGYVIEGENGKFLTEGYGWWPHETPEEAWVHSETVLAYLREHARDWPTKPAVVYPVTRNDGKTCVGQGFPFSFEDLS